MQFYWLNCASPFIISAYFFAVVSTFFSLNLFSLNINALPSALKKHNCFANVLIISQISTKSTHFLLEVLEMFLLTMPKL